MRWPRKCGKFWTVLPDEKKFVSRTALLSQEQIGPHADLVLQMQELAFAQRFKEEETLDFITAVASKKLQLLTVFDSLGYYL